VKHHPSCAFLHWRECHGARQSFPGRGARSVPLPPLRRLRGRTAAAERARCAVARATRPPRVKHTRLVGARAQPANAVLRRSNEGSARRAARAHAERARPSLTRLATGFVTTVCMPKEGMPFHSLSGSIVQRHSSLPAVGIPIYPASDPVTPHSFINRSSKLL
jgi:hypothetical protein